MRFESKTDEQIATEGMPPEGWHEAEVVSAEDKVSDRGNEMIELSLRLFTPNGERQRKDWILPAFAKKLKHFCDAAGLDKQYKLGNVVAADCVGKVVMAEIKHTIQKSGEYAGQSQANVNDYKAIDRKAGYKAPAPKAAPVAEEIGVDDIPF